MSTTIECEVEIDVIDELLKNKDAVLEFLKDEISIYTSATDKTLHTVLWVHNIRDTDYSIDFTKQLFSDYNDMISDDETYALDSLKLHKKHFKYILRKIENLIYEIEKR